MKNKISTKNQFLKLRDQIKKYNNSYYDSKPDITDSEFDKLKVRYEKFLKEISAKHQAASSKRPGPRKIKYGGNPNNPQAI